VQATVSEAIGPGASAVIIGRRDTGPIETSASRRAAFPLELARELEEAAAICGESVLRVGPATAPPERVVYAPELISRRPNAAPSLRQSGPSVVSHRPTREHDRSQFERVFAAGRDPWRYTTPYEQTKYEQTLHLLPPGPIHRALEIGCAEGHFTRQLAARVDSLIAADLSDIALRRAMDRCAGRDHVSFLQLDLTTDPLPGSFDLIVCSELLYYMGDRNGLAAVARKLADALKPGGYLLHAHAHLVVDEPDQAGFDWAHPFGAKTIGEVLASTRPLHLVDETRVPLYRIQLFRSGDADAAPRVTVLPRQPTPLLPEVERHVRWHGGTTQTGPASAPVSTAALPILMYHQIAPAEGSVTDRYRLTPGDFEAQLDYLRDSGYYSVSLETWREAMGRHTPLPGRAVMLTFDDGYRDFEVHAWPLLKQYGFSAIVFLVTGEIGGSNRWDRRHREPAPLLDWDSIERLREQGVAFGSHTASHPFLTALRPADVIRELVTSRTALTRAFQTPVDVVAYPYGAEDSIVHHLAGAAGFTFGLTSRPGRSGLWDPLLALPRIEVRGDRTFAEFVTGLGD
jgi:peptidoglycan/xylan/chitin deacetylase (PgdA/CDA1 family)/2-polyprenyl-3-methyl-5-hydroxy-6-metoxy-1,4-benzoquinol methylase